MKVQLFVGTFDMPYTRAPSDFSETGLPWGAFCKCFLCGRVARSTNAFDYYSTEGPGAPLVCGGCKGCDNPERIQEWEDRIARGEFTCDPLGPGCRGGIPLEPDGAQA